MDESPSMLGSTPLRRSGSHARVVSKRMELQASVYRSKRVLFQLELHQRATWNAQADNVQSTYIASRYTRRGSTAVD